MTKLLISILFTMLFACEDSGENTVQMKDDADFKVGVNDTLTISQRDTAPVEGLREVTVAPKNGEVLIDAFSIKYVPNKNFKGKDYLEITNKASAGDANFFVTSVDKYTINVE